uniref:Ig-like domain-containing protein n=1 Tax=Castor canadensis TaxID=51338 RepID=A0A8C0WJ15_CASCN
METPSAPPRRMGYTWQGLLLSVSLLSFWNLLTTAQLTIESVPANAAEGSDVLLRVHNSPENLQGYYWYKGESAMDNQQIALYVIATQETRPGSVYSGREMIYHNGSLLLQNVTQKDTGFYTLCTKTGHLQIEEASVQLFVFTELPKPFITSTNSSPVEGKDSVALMCEPETPDTTYLWWINGHRVADSDSLELSKDNRTLTLLRVTRNDTGNYECGTRNPVSANRSDPVTLNVLYGPDTPITSPPESHFRPGDSLRLFCHTASNPAAQYSWLFNGRPQSSTQELFIPNVTANNAGSYTCLVHNSATGVSRTTVKNILVLLPKPFITSTNSSPVEGKDSVALMCEPETPDTTYLWWINGHRVADSDSLELSKDNRTLTLLRVTRNDTGNYECGTRNPVSANRSDPVTLNVLYGPDTPITSPPESHFRPGDNLRLFCHTASNPAAQYSWLFNGRPQSSTQELFIPNVTANNAGSYTCLVHNSATGVTPSSGVVPGFSGRTGRTIVTGVVLGVVLVVAVTCFLFLRRTGRY